MPHRPRFSLVQLEAIMDAVASGVVVCSPDGRVISMNSAALVMHGMASADEIIQRDGYFGSVLETWLPDGTPVPADGWPAMRAVQGETIEDMELVVRRRDSGLAFVGSYTAVPIRDLDGAISLVIVSVQDVTARREDVEGLRRRNRHVSAALTAGGTGTFRWVIGTNQFEADHALEDLLNAQPGNLDGLFALLSADSADEMRRAMRDCASGQRELEVETRMPGRDGRDRFLAWRGLGLRDATSRVVAVTGACLDITARRELDERLRQMERAESVGRLAGGVAHEVNNQMSVVLGCADFLLRRTDLAAEAREDVEQMRQAAERSAAVTSQLLAYSRRQVLRAEVIELDATVRAIAPALQRAMGEDRTVRLMLGAAGARVRADVGQLDQALINLTLNARDATPVGGELRLETSVVTIDAEYARRHVQAEVRAGRYVMLAASDTGCGMSRETMARVFEPFFTTKDVGEGTGLGLSTVYGIVKQSDGYIWIYSELGRGTVVKIYLPFVAAAATEPPSAPAPPQPQAFAKAGTILVVEDEPAVRLMVVRALVQAGFTVLEADGPLPALELAREAADDLVCVVTDVIMPDMDGRSLADELAVFCKAPVLFMSGYTEQDATLRGLLEDGVPFLQKPFPPSRLVAAVQQLLGTAVVSGDRQT
jgi:PAS domain S-box-containing protein